MMSTKKDLDAIDQCPHRYRKRSIRVRSRTTRNTKAPLLLLSFIFIVPLQFLNFTNATNDGLKSPTNHELNQDSVVLITGAAGFLGSHLGIALHRTYNISKLICIDTLNAQDLKLTSSTLEEEKSPVEFRPPEDEAQRKVVQKAEKAFAVFEFKRQRLFHLLQSVGSSKAYFYKLDIRDTVPEDFKLENYSALDSIFRTHKDITHVVHLAGLEEKDQRRIVDVSTSSEGGMENKMGMLDVILEQLYKIQRGGRNDVKINDNGEEVDFQSDEIFIPHLTYASSYKVYPQQQKKDSHDEYGTSKNHLKADEQQSIDTPDSFQSASVLLDEILAKSYNQMHGLYSIGLRFFDVYGPFGTPNTPLSDMAERAVSSQSKDTPILANIVENSDEFNGDGNVRDIRDFIYIDDAIDAIMAAMQLRPTPQQHEVKRNSNKNSDSKQSTVSKSLVVNVGTGRGSNLIEIANMMEGYFPRSTKEATTTSHIHDVYSKDELSDARVAISSNERAEALLGFKPQVSLQTGIEKLLSWHYDRAYPFGSDEPDDTEEGEEEEKNKFEESSMNLIVQQGIQSCSRFDEECLQGAAIFPCASACSHRKNCAPSIYDEVIDISRSLTASCRNVLYTVDLDEHLDNIFSAMVDVSPDAKPFLAQKYCNIAFVSEKSFLVQKLKEQKGIKEDIIMVRQLKKALTNSRLEGTLLTHGKWILLPVTVPKFLDEKEFFLQTVLPKTSPDLFFSSNTEYAIYCDPKVILLDSNVLFKSMEAQMTKAGKEGKVVMMMSSIDSKNRQQSSTIGSTFQTGSEISTMSILQHSTYNAIQFSLQGLLKDKKLDSSWIGHSLSSDDGRLLRCDIYREIMKWNVVKNYDGTMNFIISLHEFWSAILAKWVNGSVWWRSSDEDVTSLLGVLSSTKVHSFVKVLASDVRVIEKTQL